MHPPPHRPKRPNPLLEDSRDWPLALANARASVRLAAEEPFDFADYCRFLQDEPAGTSCSGYELESPCTTWPPFGAGDVASESTRPSPQTNDTLLPQSPRQWKWPAAPAPDLGPTAWTFAPPRLEKWLGWELRTSKGASEFET